MNQHLTLLHNQVSNDPTFIKREDYPERYESKIVTLKCDICNHTFPLWITSESQSKNICLLCFRKLDHSIHTILIASSKSPKEHQKDGFIKCILNAAKEDFHCEVIAMLGREGFGCYNFGIKIRGGMWQKFADAMTMTLMPAKYCLCDEKFDGFELHDLKS